MVNMSTICQLWFAHLVCGDLFQSHTHHASHLQLEHYSFLGSITLLNCKADSQEAQKEEDDESESLLFSKTLSSLITLKSETR